MKDISGIELQEKLTQEKELIILDVREKEDYEKGHIKGAIRLEQNQVTYEIEDIAPELDTPICVYCYSGNRSTRVAMLLEYLGYTEVYNLGGIDNWSYELDTENIVD